MRSNPRILHRAGALRREPTPAEVRLWSFLRRNQVAGTRFRRQLAVGQYVVDFCSPKRKLAIELDGSGHLAQEKEDAERTAFLESQGYRVLRFWNDSVLNDIEGVIRAIQLALNE